MRDDPFRWDATNDRSIAPNLKVHKLKQHVHG